MLQSHTPSCWVGGFRFASLCSGSGLGDVGLHHLFEAFQRVGNVKCPHACCSFLCENDQRKAAHLARLIDTQSSATTPEALGHKRYIFKDITQLSSETAEVWDTSMRVPVPPTDFLFYGFSCKDLSMQNKNANAMTQCLVVLLHGCC